MRASAQPGLYQHWYVDGRAVDHAILNEKPQSSSIQTVSYAAQEPVRKRVVDAMYSVRTSGGAGPERLRSILAEMSSEEHSRKEDHSLM
jgi:hypothetical protein